MRIEQSATRDFTYPDLARAIPVWPTEAITVAAKQPVSDESLRITRALQTTLDTEELLETFYKEIKKLISYSGLSYSNIPQGIEYTVGKAAPHACAYHLVIAGESLGELRFTRRKKFTDQETMVIEYLMCSLVYPLRNTLMYKHALQMALKDPLTGVNNRVAMDSTLQREVELANRYGTPLSLIALDVDRFKRINDTYGHANGDRVLKSVASAAVSSIRSTDIIFRFGGEEFIILLSNTAEEGALCLAERIRQRIQAGKYMCNEAMISATASLGVACLNKGENVHSLFSRADQALYRAKSEGRNCVKLA
jgi:diguanylate cyclase (GGDEF)-like protein